MKYALGLGFRLKSYLWDLGDAIMGFDTIKRFDRIVAILIQLQSKRIVRAQDLADRFEVSLRTIYRDIRSLEASGVPIASEAGVGYSIMEGYRLPPVMFTREEAGSFVAAEKLMQKFTDKSLGAYHESAMYKVKSVLRGREKDWISALESQVRIDPAQALFNEDIPDALEILFESIAEKKHGNGKDQDPHLGGQENCQIHGYQSQPIRFHLRNGQKGGCGNDLYGFPRGKRYCSMVPDVRRLCNDFRTRKSKGTGKGTVEKNR